MLSMLSAKPAMASKCETSDRRQLVNPNASFMRAFSPMVDAHVKHYQGMEQLFTQSRLRYPRINNLGRWSGVALYTHNGMKQSPRGIRLVTTRTSSNRCELCFTKSVGYDEGPV